MSGSASVCWFLFIVHHILNRRWIVSAFHGRYSPFRALQTALAALVFLTMVGSAVSGIALSKHIFSLVTLGGASLARNVHMLCGYWNLVLMSLHLGLHWSMIVGKEFYYIVTCADEDKASQKTTLACFRGFADCVNGAVEKGVIYGTGVYRPGEIRKAPACKEAYEMGKMI